MSGSPEPRAARQRPRGEFIGPLQDPAYPDGGPRRTASLLELAAAVLFLAAFTAVMALFAVSLGALALMLVVALWAGGTAIVLAAAWRHRLWPSRR